VEQNEPGTGGSLGQQRPASRSLLHSHAPASQKQVPHPFGSGHSDDELHPGSGSQSSPPLLPPEPLLLDVPPPPLLLVPELLPDPLDEELLPDAPDEELAPNPLDEALPIPELPAPLDPAFPPELPPLLAPPPPAEPT
jgi:hypothetical protein